MVWALLSLPTLTYFALANRLVHAIRPDAITIAEDISGMPGLVEANNAENYLGHSDWRLPKVKERPSIVDYTRSSSASDAANAGPASDTDFFETTTFPSETTDDSRDYGYFWTSTSACIGADGSEYYDAWYVPLGRQFWTRPILWRVNSGTHLNKGMRKISARRSAAVCFWFLGIGVYSGFDR